MWVYIHTPIYTHTYIYSHIYIKFLRDKKRKNRKKTFIFSTAWNITRISNCNITPKYM